MREVSSLRPVSMITGTSESFRISRSRSKPLSTGQDEVENDQIDGQTGQRPPHGGAVFGRGHLEPTATEIEFKGFPNLRIIVDDQKVVTHRPSSVA